MSDTFETDAQKKERLKYEKKQAQMTGGLTSKALILGLGGGLIAVILLILAAGLRGALILVKTFWLYPVVLIAALIVAVIVNIKFNKIPGFFAFVAICVLGSIGVTSYYKNSSMVFPSVYFADYIQALPDGNPPFLYEKIKQKGRITVKLSIDERVIVNGVNLLRNEFNITTAEGKTGWVDVLAFPKNANEMLSINIGTDGIDSEDIAIDRQVERLMEKYLTVDKHMTIENIPIDIYRISESTLDRSLKTNAATPLFRVERKDFKKGKLLSETGINIKLENILYADDCTVVYLTVTDDKIWIIDGDILNTNAWRKSLIAKDLNTGEEFPLIQGNYKRTFRYEPSHGKFISSVVYFFPPFKSRYFSLTHNNISPLPINKNAGYGGILGLLSSATSMRRAYDYFFDWNFPEVDVR